MDFLDFIYNSLIGLLNANTALPWVPNAFAPGSPCSEAYTRLVAARDRVLAKLQQEEDEDLEQMLQEMDTIQQLLCRKILELRIPSN